MSIVPERAGPQVPDTLKELVEINVARRLAREEKKTTKEKASLRAPSQAAATAADQPESCHDSASRSGMASDAEHVAGGAERRRVGGLLLNHRPR